MTTTTFSALPDNSTNANFRAWGKGFSDALTAVGIPKTPDTGQAIWDTAVAPTGTNTYTVYEIRRFDDALQPTAPIFIKFEFGTGSSTNSASIRFVTGTGSDGVGNIAGNRHAPLTASASASSTSVQMTSLVSGASNRLACAIASVGTLTSTGLHFAIERTKDDNGNDTTAGALITCVAPGGSAKANQYLPFTGSVPASDVLASLAPILGTGTDTLVATNPPSGTDGSNVNYYPNFAFRGGTLLNPNLNIFMYFNANVNPGTVDVVSRYGQNRTYYFIGNNTSFTGLIRGNAAWIANTTLAILWE